MVERVREMHSLLERARDFVTEESAGGHLKNENAIWTFTRSDSASHARMGS